MRQIVSAVRCTVWTVGRVQGTALYNVRHSSCSWTGDVKVLISWGCLGLGLLQLRYPHTVLKTTKHKLVCLNVNLCIIFLLFARVSLLRFYSGDCWIPRHLKTFTLLPGLTINCSLIAIAVMLSWSSQLRTSLLCSMFQNIFLVLKMVKVCDFWSWM